VLWRKAKRIWSLGFLSTLILYGRVLTECIGAFLRPFFVLLTKKYRIPDGEFRMGGCYGVAQIPLHMVDLVSSAFVAALRAHVHGRAWFSPSREWLFSLAD